MTRFARAGKRKFLEASTWEDLSKGKGKDVDPGHSDTATTKKDDTSRQKSFQKKKKKVNDVKRQKQIEARRLRRQKWKCCFVCRQTGHQASDCPNKEDMKIGTCFKCGSTEHTTRKCKSTTSDNTAGAFPFAKCFICQEMGHLAKSCPENPRGLYPQGGGCKICGSVEHLKRDCPELQRNKKSKGYTAETVALKTSENSQHCSADAEDTEEPKSLETKKHKRKKEKVVEF